MVTSSRRIPHPLTAAEARQRVDFILRSRKIVKLAPGPQTLRRCVAFCSENGIRGPRIFDLYLAWTLLDNGVNHLVTFDTKDFLDIPGLQTRLPSAVA